MSRQNRGGSHSSDGRNSRAYGEESSMESSMRALSLTGVAPSDERPQGRGRARGRVRTSKPECTIPGSAPAYSDTAQNKKLDFPTKDKARAQQFQGAGNGLSARNDDNLSGKGLDTSDAGLSRGRGRRATRFTPEILQTRPQHITTKQGTSGARVTILANSFLVKSPMKWCLYQHHVYFAPDEDRTFIRKVLLRQHRQRLGGYLFDGSILYTSLPVAPSGPLELVSVLERKPGVNENTDPVKITIKQVGQLHTGDHQHLQVFSILLRRCLSHLRLQLIGRNFYDPKGRVEVKEYRLELWPGYITSIRQHEDNILLTAEISNRVMRGDTALDVLRESRDKNPQDYQNIFKRIVIGATVLTDYNNRTYRVDDVDFTVSPQSTFQLASQETITYMQYYKQKYALNIWETTQPMLVSRSNMRERRSGMPNLVYLVPELCRLTGLSDDMRTNFQLMRTLATHTRLGPAQRADVLRRFMQRLRSEEKVVNELGEWNLELSPNLIELEGRVMPTESIVQGNMIKYQPSKASDWTRELRSNPLVLMPVLNNWSVVCSASQRQATQGFVRTLTKAAAGMGFQIPSPNIGILRDDRNGSYVEQLEQQVCGYNPQLIMCVVPNNRLDRYAVIKKKCCIERSVATQVILAKTMGSTGVMSVATKVAIQIACKLGGAPWSVEIPLAGLMVAGFDVCPDARGRDKGSFGALVASLDKGCSRYFSAVSHQVNGEELSNDLSVNMCAAIHRYNECNGALPSRIVMYRDGVGDGNLAYVAQHEVQTFRDRIGDMYQRAGVPLRLAYIIVSKRINTRFFLGKDNVPPGTVVDSVVTLPERYDFFLVSQSVRQGTVSPTSYNILYDNVGLEPDKIQRLTYKLTHLYFNWSGTVRVPAPCQYAHKLAYLVGQALHQVPSKGLQDKLYYL